MADYQQKFLASLQGGLNLGQQLRGIQNKNQLNQLASQAYQAAPEERQAIYGQAAGIDAGAAGALEKQLGSNEDRRNTTMVNMAKLLTSAPPQARAGLYQRMVPTLSQYGMSDLPQQYDAQTAPIIDQAAQSIVSAFNGLDKNTPTDVRSFQQMTAGLSQEDRERARRINLGLDGRASSSGFSQVKFTGADGRERIGVLNGKTGQIDLPDGTSFNPQTGAISQTPQQTQQTVPPPGLYNTPNGPARIGEGLTPEQWQLVQADMANGGAADNYQLPDRNVTPAQRSAAGGAFVGRAPEEQAAATEAAKLNVQQQFLPQELQMRTQAAIQQAGGSAQAKGEAEARLEAVQNLPRVMQESTNAINLIDQALRHPGLATAVGASGRADPRNYLPGTDATDFRVLLDQIKGGTFLQAFQSLKGGGAITEVEGTKAEQAIARLNRDQSEQSFRQSLQDLREVAQAAITRAQTKAQAAGGGVQGQRQRTVVRSGMSNGRRVVQYSDGTIDYGN